MDQTSTIKHELFTREYNLGDLLSLAWKIFSENFQTILIITLIVYVPIELVSAFVPSTSYPNANLAATGILVLIGGILAPLAITLVIRKQLDNQTLDYKSALRQAVNKWLPGISTSLLTGICLLGLFLLLVVPGIIFMVYWSFAIYIVALNNLSGWNALKYSKEIVRGRWWRVLGYFVIFGLISGLIGVVINTPITSFADNRAGYFISALLSDIVFSFIIVASVLFFLNLEAIKAPTTTSDKKAEVPK